MVEHRAVAAGVAGSTPVAHPCINILSTIMNIEKFPTKDTESQKIARRLLEKFPIGSKEYTKLVVDLEWFFDVAKAFLSPDHDERNRAQQEKNRNYDRYMLLAGYGEGLSVTELRDLIHHLKYGVESFPKTERSAQHVA